MPKDTMPKTFQTTDPEFLEAEAALETVRDDWLRIPDVFAVDVGYKIKDDKIQDRLAIRAHVRRKRDEDLLARDDRLPGVVDGVPVDVLRAAYSPLEEYAAPAPKPASRRKPVPTEKPPEPAPTATPSATPRTLMRWDRLSPLAGGMSIGPPEPTGGTLGAIVWDRTDGTPCMLSNWHVLARGVAPERPVFQPGGFDGGTEADTVGQLKRPRFDADVDAALAELDGARPICSEIIGLGPITGIAEPHIGMRVSKSGRSTGVTRGMIDGLRLSVRIDFGRGVEQIFHDQIHIVPRPPWPAERYELSRSGDSGAVWIEDETGRAVGLHFAGESPSSPTGEHAAANRMSKVAELLQFSFSPRFMRFEELRRPNAALAAEPVPLIKP